MTRLYSVEKLNGQIGGSLSLKTAYPAACWYWSTRSPQKLVRQGRARRIEPTSPATFQLEKPGLSAGPFVLPPKAFAFISRPADWRALWLSERRSSRSGSTRSTERTCSGRDICPD